MLEKEELAKIVQDILPGFVLSIPVEISSSIILKNPQYFGLSFTINDLLLIISCKFLIIILAIAIIEAMRRWGLMYAIGYLIGYLFIAIFLGFEILNLIMIFAIIFIAFIITIIRMILEYR
ncbi:MAG: hypothetical protein NO483_02690 [Candidatus Methanomethylicia archaeon]|nr:hypothetical protein [Candidatus Methanomethylicia archaeon]